MWDDTYLTPIFGHIPTCPCPQNAREIGFWYHRMALVWRIQVNARRSIGVHVTLSRYNHIRSAFLLPCRYGNTILLYWLGVRAYIDSEYSCSCMQQDYKYAINGVLFVGRVKNGHISDISTMNFRTGWSVHSGWSFCQYAHRWLNIHILQIWLFNCTITLGSETYFDPVLSNASSFPKENAHKAFFQS